MGKGKNEKIKKIGTDHTTIIEEGEEERINSKSNEHVNHNDMLVKYVEKILSSPLNTSLTKNFVSLELAEKEKDVRTADNVGLGSCIYVNVKNMKSYFPYALSADCYCVFCDFFGPLIDEYHGPPQCEAPLEAMFGATNEYCKLDLNFNNRSRVLYCDIIIRRNIEGIPFAGLMTAADRKKVVSLLEPKFRKIFRFSNEIASMPLEWEDRIDSIKNELDEVGKTMEDYPNDRLYLIYTAAASSNQGVILNFDDHLQIVVSTRSGSIGYIYNLIQEIYNHEELDKVDFVAHPYLGFLTLSPAHVGVCLTVRIIAKFPFLNKLDDVSETILRDHDVLVEPTVPTCSESGLITIYNKITLNKTEESILIEVVSAFSDLYDIEQEIEDTTPMAVQNDTMPVESLFRLYALFECSESRSYTRKYMTLTLVNEFCNVTTAMGSTINHCIRGNAYYPESLHPRAADAQCYLKFKMFFDPILMEINKISTLSHPLKPDYGIASDNTQHMLFHRDILSYRVRFCRNFASYPFPLTMSDRHREEVERILVSTFSELPVEIEGEYLPLCDIKRSVYFEDLYNANLLPTINEVDKSFGYYRKWPMHRGIFLVKPDPKFPELILVIYVNITDHIKVVCLDTSGQVLFACYDRAVKVMMFLDLRFDQKFARKPEYGYFASLPQSTGCGLRISAKVFLKNLGCHREVLERKCKEFHFAYRGSNGAGSPAIGNKFDICLKLNMNVTEKYILMTFCQRLKELILCEREYDARVPRPLNDVFSKEDSITDTSIDSLECSSETKTLSSLNDDKTNETNNKVKIK